MNHQWCKHVRLNSVFCHLIITKLMLTRGDRSLLFFLHSFIDALWPSWSATGNPSLFEERRTQLGRNRSLFSFPSADKPPSAPHSLRSSAAPGAPPSAAGTMTATRSSSTTLLKSFHRFHLTDWKLKQMGFFICCPESKEQLKDTNFPSISEHPAIDFTNKDECHCQLCTWFKWRLWNYMHACMRL